MDKFRLVLNKIQDCIEMQNGATESQLKTIWNDLSDAISESERGQKADTEESNCTIFDVSNSYCGEQGEENMKADIKEIMHAVGDKFDFLRLCNEAQEELYEAAFDLDQESRMNGV